MPNESHHFSGGKVIKFKNNVLLIQYDKSREITVEDLESLTELRKEILGEKPYYPIIDLTNGVTSFTENAKAWVAVNKESSEVRIMDILLVKSRMMKLKIKMYYSLYKPKIKSKVVSTIDEALEFIVVHEEKKRRRAKVNKQ